MKKNLPTDPLTPKEILFIKEYLIDFNGTRAIKAAGYQYSKDEGFRTAASDMLTKPNIQAFLKNEFQNRCAKVDLDIEFVLTRLKDIADCDISEAFVDDDSEVLKPLKDIPKNVRKCISSFEVEELFDWEDNKKIKIGRVKKVKFWNKDKSLENIGKYLSMFVEKRMDMKGSSDDSTFRDEFFGIK